MYYMFGSGSFLKNKYKTIFYILSFNIDFKNYF